MPFPPPGHTVADFQPTFPLEAELRAVWESTGRQSTPRIESIGDIARWQGPGFTAVDGARYWVLANGDIVVDDGILVRAFPYSVTTGGDSEPGDGPGNALVSFVRRRPLVSALLAWVAYKAWEGR